MLLPIGRVGTYERSSKWVVLRRALPSKSLRYVGNLIGTRS